MGKETCITDLLLDEEWNRLWTLCGQVLDRQDWFWAEGMTEAERTIACHRLVDRLAIAVEEFCRGRAAGP